VLFDYLVYECMFSSSSFVESRLTNDRFLVDTIA